MTKQLRIVLISAISLVTALTIGLLVSLQNPLRIDTATIAKNVMQPIDFSFSMVASVTQSDVTTVEYPIFNASAECVEDGKMAKLLDGAKVLASLDMDDQQAKVFAGEDVVQFKTSGEVDQFMTLLRDGYNNTSCSYNSTTKAAKFTSQLGNLTTAEDLLGVGGSGSVAFTQRVTIDADEYNWHLDFTKVVAVIPAGDCLLVLTGSTSKDALVGISDMQSSLGAVAKKALGITK